MSRRTKRTKKPLTLTLTRPDRDMVRIRLDQQIITHGPRLVVAYNERTADREKVTNGLAPLLALSSLIGFDFDDAPLDLSEEAAGLIAIFALDAVADQSIVSEGVAEFWLELAARFELTMHAHGTGYEQKLREIVAEDAA